jgi:hypothetical protein
MAKDINQLRSVQSESVRVLQEYVSTAVHKPTKGGIKSSQVLTTHPVEHLPEPDWLYERGAVKCFSKARDILMHEVNVPLYVLR